MHLGRRASWSPKGILCGRGSARSLLRALAAIVMVGAAVSCSDSTESRRAPIAPTAPPTPKSTPAVTGIVPAVGSVDGDTTVRISGSGFMPGMVATLGGIQIGTRSGSRDASSTIYAETPAHGIGTVDLVVTNPDGGSQQVAGAYTYVARESFDMNGDWGGYSTNGTDRLVEFLIRDNILVKASCTYDGRVALDLGRPPGVAHGEFSVFAEGEAMISGRIVSASEIVGTISVPGCTESISPWRATRGPE